MSAAAVGSAQSLHRKDGRRHLQFGVSIAAQVQMESHTLAQRQSVAPLLAAKAHGDVVDARRQRP